MRLSSLEIEICVKLSTCIKEMKIINVSRMSSEKKLWSKFPTSKE